MTKVTRYASMILNNHGDLLAYSCQSFTSQVEEWAKKNILNWDRHKELGAKIVDVEIAYMPLEDVLKGIHESANIQNTVYEVEVRYHHGLISWGLWKSCPNIEVANAEYDLLMEKSKHPLCIFNDVRIIEVVSNRRPIKTT